MAADGKVVHRRDFDDAGLALGQIKFFIFFFEVERHRFLWIMMVVGFIITDMMVKKCGKTIVLV